MGVLMLLPNDFLKFLCMLKQLKVFNISKYFSCSFFYFLSTSSFSYPFPLSTFFFLSILQSTKSEKFYAEDKVLEINSEQPTFGAS